MRQKSEIKTEESDRTGTAALIKYITTDIDNKIKMININADADINGFEKTVKNEITEFEIQQNRISDEAIKSDGQKITNRNLIDKKKEGLEIINNFMNEIINEAASAVQNDAGYHDFLLRTVIRSVKEIRGSRITLKISRRDGVYSEIILKAIEDNGLKLKAEIIIDDEIKNGGAVIIDEDNEVIYNDSLDRIIYRKNELLRKEILIFLNEYRDARDRN